MKKVNLQYRPIAERRTNEVAHIVPHEHVLAVNESIQQKNERNRIEQQSVSKDASDFNCK